MIASFHPAPGLFQFLGRNSGGLGLARTGGILPGYGFQFLGRNSGGLGNSSPCLTRVLVRLFQFLGRNSGGLGIQIDHEDFCEAFVSIPRSEFWWFRPDDIIRLRASPVSFNSSVGILVV